MSSPDRLQGEGPQGHRRQRGLCLQGFYEGGASTGMVCQELQEFQDLRGLHRRSIHGMAEVREEEGTSFV